MNDMTTEKQNKRPNVPPLRFPEFTEPWRRSIIEEETSEFQSGKFIKAGLIKYEGMFPVYGGNGLRGYTNTYNHIGDYVLIGRQGALCGNVRFVTDRTYITEHAIAVKASDKNDIKFFQYLFERMNLGQFSDQSAQPGLAVSKLLKLRIQIPQKQEQKKIASLLSMIDCRIAVQNKIIEDLRQLKSAFVDEFFCGKSNWVAYKYKEILCPISERNKALKITNVLSASQEHGMISRDELDIDIKFESSAISTYKMVQPGDYVLHLRSFQGGLAFSRITGICSPAYTILRPTKVVTYGFFEEFFMSKRFINSLRLVTYGIRDGRSINVDEFLNMNISIPNMDTQRKLVQILSVFRQRLNNAQTILQKYISQKQFLLRQMFI